MTAKIRGLVLKACCGTAKYTHPLHQCTPGKRGKKRKKNRFSRVAGEQPSAEGATVHSLNIFFRLRLMGRKDKRGNGDSYSKRNEIENGGRELERHEGKKEKIVR
jgi:hypothetical protein